MLLLAGCARPDATWRRIQAEGVLRVGLDPTYPPFEVDEGQGLQGLDVDLARALAGELGLRAEFVYFGYDGLYDALGTGQVDVLISALVVQPERSRDFSYSASYFNAGQWLVTAPDSPLTGPASLGGRTLAVELGAQGHVLATTWARRLPELTIQTHDTPSGALEAVRAGQADAAMVDAVSAGEYLRPAPAALRLVEPPLSDEPYALVVRREDETLLARLNEALGHLRDGGALDRIVAGYLAGLPPVGPD